MNYKLDTDKQVFFYEQEFYVLSNFSAFSIWWEGKRFMTSEHLYHWLKFEDEEIKDRIYNAISAHRAFEIGRNNIKYVRKNWDAIKEDTMYNILKAKVAQHAYVEKKLIETGDRELIEDSWRDDFWGWGPRKNGQNKLGKLWMRLRKELEN